MSRRIRYVIYALIALASSAFGQQALCAKAPFYQLGEGDAIPIKQSPAEYPAIAQTTSTKGNVQIAICVFVDGAVAYSRVLGGSPMLTKAALDAAARWRFQPPTLPFQTVLEFEFSLSPPAAVVVNDMSFKVCLRDSMAKCQAAGVAAGCQELSDVVKADPNLQFCCKAGRTSAARPSLFRGSTKARSR